MIDLIHNRPTGPMPELFDNDRCAFAMITVRPRPDAGIKPEMPLLSRGQCLMDARLEVWTVLAATVLTEEDEYSGSELPYRYAYEYMVVYGRRRVD
jgi:hypothetical protein